MSSKNFRQKKTKVGWKKGGRGNRHAAYGPSEEEETLTGKTRSPDKDGARRLPANGRGRNRKREGVKESPREEE